MKFGLVEAVALAVLVGFIYLVLHTNMVLNYLDILRGNFR